MVLIGPGRKLLRGDPIEARMGPVVIEVVTPTIDDLLPFMGITPEQMLIRWPHPQELAARAASIPKHLAGSRAGTLSPSVRKATDF